jgi:hypothetical protein
LGEKEDLISSGKIVFLKTFKKKFNIQTKVIKILRAITENEFGVNEVLALPTF